MLNTQYAYEHDPCLLHPSVSLRSLNYRFEQSNLGNEPANLLLTHDNDISLPILYEHLVYLKYVNFFDNLPYCKTKKFLETKVAAIKLREFGMPQCG